MTRIAWLILAVVGLGLFQSGTALAAVPPNDNFANATPISALPFTGSGNLKGTTTEPGEPQACGDTEAQTIWYAFRPAVNTTVNADLNGSDLGVIFSVYQQNGSGFSGLDFLQCAEFGGSSVFTAQADITYYFQVGSLQTGTANFQFHAQRIPPPPNDDFAKATNASALPFSDEVNNGNAATLQHGEPGPCEGGSQSSSVWWAFTPAVTGAYSATAGGALGGFTTLAAYQGTALRHLSGVACTGPFQVMTFDATAGLTYYLQASGPWNLAPGFPLEFQLQAAPIAPLKVTTTAVPAGILGAAYSATLAATGGTPPYTWSVTAGTLPDGLSLDPAAGIISGTAAVAGTSGFTVGVTDSEKPAMAASQALSVTAAGCTATITGDRRRPLHVVSGVTCITGASISGPVTISAGATVAISQSTLRGPLRSAGAGTLSICASRIAGPISVTGSTGLVLIGDAGDGGTVGCEPDTISGPVILAGNTAGIQVGGNTVRGPVRLTGNNSSTAAAEVEANQIRGLLACSGNTPPPADNGQPNAVNGPATGQCAELAQPNRRCP